MARSHHFKLTLQNPPAADPNRTRELAALLDRRALRPVISHLLPLAAAAKAHRILEGRDAGGKIVLDVTGS